MLQCEAITDIDVTAADMLEQLDVELNAAGVHLAFVELRGRLQDLVLRYGLFETLDRDHFYPTLETALDDDRAGAEHAPIEPAGDGGVARTRRSRPSVEEELDAVTQEDFQALGRRHGRTGSCCEIGAFSARAVAALLLHRTSTAVVRVPGSRAGHAS